MPSFVTTPTVAGQQGPGGNSATLSIHAVEPVYPGMTVSVDWGDGQTEEVTTGQSYIAYLAHIYQSDGEFAIQVMVSNAAYPAPESVAWYGEVSFAQAGFEPVVTRGADAAVVGPILPEFVGSPEASTWAFNFGTDDRCLLSSLYLLLTTSRGERLMLPNYGTNLRQLVFSQNDTTLDDAIRADIATAVARWEPRAQLEAVRISKVNRQVQVNVEFRSLISSTNIPVQIIVR